MLKPKLGLSPVKRATKVRHVEIVIGGKENALKDLKPKGKIDLKGKGKEVEKVEVEEVDFDALCGGMDWEEDEDSPVKERVATVSCPVISSIDDLLTFEATDSERQAIHEMYRRKCGRQRNQCRPL